jgi:hypothetical protein
VSGFWQTSLATILCALTIGCGGDGPTGPSATSGYNGQWSGTAAQGRPITFTVAANHVTAMSIGYSFGTCSGTKTFSNLNLEIADLPQPPGAPTTAKVTGFAYGIGAPDGSSVQIQGFFRSNTTVDGLVVFAEYPGCGDWFGFWNATKR